MTNNWKNIRLDFQNNPSLVGKWIDSGFSYEDVRDWEKIWGNNFNPYDYDFFSWLVNVKGGIYANPYWWINTSLKVTEDQLRKEYQEYLESEFDLVQKKWDGRVPWKQWETKEKLESLAKGLKEKIDSNMWERERKRRKNEFFFLKEEDFAYQQQGSSTSTKKFLKNLTKLKSRSPEKKPVVLIMDGSMNPVHNKHIHNLEIAKKEIETCDSDLKVVAGYIFPNGDHLVRRKLDDQTISIEHRIEMVRLATEESDWLEVGKWGQKCEEGFLYEPIFFLQIVTDLSDYLNARWTKVSKEIESRGFHEVEIVVVVGSDVAEKYSEYFVGYPEGKLGLAAKGFRTIIVSRKKVVNWEENVKSSLSQVCAINKWKKFIFFATSENEFEISSTLIRELIKAEDYMVNKKRLLKLLHPKVLEYIEKNKIFKDKEKEVVVASVEINNSSI